MSLSFPQCKFQIIYADPPWSFRTWSSRGKSRSPEKHYDCMTLADIQQMPIPDIADKNCSLFLWATDPLLPEALNLIKEWGFKYKTIAFNWVKLNPKAPHFGWHKQDFFTGMGYWTRANPELCLLATKGKPTRKRADIRRLVISPRREHSRKPDLVAERIVNLMGDIPRIELFARQPREGWTVWGNETNKWND